MTDYTPGITTMEAFEEIKWRLADYDRLKEERDELLIIVVALDKSWTGDIPDGPNAEFREGFSIGEDHKILWKRIRAIIAKVGK